VARFARHYFDRDHDEYQAMIAPEYQVGDVTREYVARRLAEPGAAGFLDQVLRLDVTTLVVDDPVKRVDNMTMAWGLEARVPFLDHRLVETAMAMPAHLKLPEGGKHPLKVIARKYLPPEVIDRPKGYFPMPALKYVRGEFLAFMREVLESPACRARGLYRRDYVERLLAEPERHHTRLQGSKLWHLALLELWTQDIRRRTHDHPAGHPQTTDRREPRHHLHEGDPRTAHVRLLPARRPGDDGHRGRVRLRERAAEPADHGRAAQGGRLAHLPPDLHRR